MPNLKGVKMPSSTQREAEIKKLYPNIIPRREFVDQCLKKAIGKETTKEIIKAISEEFSKPNTYYKEDHDEIESILRKLETKMRAEESAEEFSPKEQEKILEHFGSNVSLKAKTTEELKANISQIDETRRFETFENYIKKEFANLKEKIGK